MTITETLDHTENLSGSRPKRPWCLFQSGTSAYAVSLETVAEVVEVERLVRMPLGPPRIIALCTLRREVVPLVNLSDSPKERTTAALSAKTIVLVLRTSRGTWAVPVNAEGTLVTEGCIDAPEPGDRGKKRGSRPGTLSKGATTYTVIDPDATWHEIRRSVDAWYQDHRGVEPALKSGASHDRL